MTTATLSEAHSAADVHHARAELEVPALHTDILFGCKVIIKDKARLDLKLKKFHDDGPGALNVVSDFDFTISRFHNKKGERGFSCHKLLEDSGLLAPEYHVQAQAVQAHYYPIEIDPSLDQATRLPLMIEWAHRSHELLVKYGMTKEVMQRAVDNAVAREEIRLREHLVAFFDTLKAASVPMLVFSAGIADVLEGVLAHFIELQDHQPYVISNRCIWEGSTLVSFPEPIIHVFNKRAQYFLDTPFFARPDRLRRHNLLLVGDSLGDVSMDEGMGEQLPGFEVIKVGFLNDKVQERADAYACAFDVVILGDPGFDVPLGLLQRVVGGGAER